MHHVAIMNKSWNMIPKIISGHKTIESRWYQTKRVPWDSIKVGDKVYFKNTGEKIIASAQVAKVLQFTLANIEETERVLAKYSEQICLVNSNPKTWSKLPKYCILIFLKNGAYLDKSFQINKTGFGMGAAWLAVKDIKSIKL